MADYDKKNQNNMTHSDEVYPIGVYLVEPDKMYEGFVVHHWHEEAEFDIVKSGTATYVINEEEIEVKEGEGIYINSNVMHSIKGKCVIFSVVFSIRGLVGTSGTIQWKTYVEPIIENKALKYYLISSENSRQERAILSYLWDIVNVQLSREFGMELTTQSALCQIWLLFVKLNHLKAIPVSEEKESNDVGRIKGAIDYIKEHYHEEIGLDEISDSIAVSKSECCRCFKRTLGLSPVEFLINYRIYIAAKFLTDSQGISVNVGELAMNVGFNNASYFNRKFKEIMGCTPSQFKREAKSEHRDFLSVRGRSISHI